MKFIVVSSVAMMGVAAGRESAAELQTELDVITRRLAADDESRVKAVLDELRMSGKTGLQGSATTSTLADSKGYLIINEAGEPGCSGGMVKLGTAMGRCYANTTVPESYYFSCDSNATHTIRSMVYCPSDATCTTCEPAVVFDEFRQSVCNDGGNVWNYQAGATCTSDTAPYESYDNGWLTMQYSSSADCASGSGDDVSFFYYTPFDECLQYIGNIKASSCDGTTLQYEGHNDTDCMIPNGAGMKIFNLTTCEMADDGEGPYYETTTCADGLDDESDDSFCFHVDSAIDYKGVTYSYEELKAGKEPECSVPHSPSSRGVIISTTCGKTARVTDTHLMATTKGFQLAYSLKAGDMLFGDYHEEHCTVTAVQKEESTQQYFGLNCVHSEVLTSGLRASTFGDFHTLPSWYMTYVGGLVGSDAASTIGGYIAEWYFQK